MDHPRFVDPRIAKGRARSISDATSQFTFLRVFDGAIKRVSKQWRPGMSGRKAFRYMERVLKPELDKHLVTFPLIRLGEMTLYCGLFEQRGATGGLDFFFLVCSSAARPEDGLMYRIEVSQHAMQRIIQRTGRTGEDEVRTRLYTAMANIYWLQPWIYREKWLQLGLACEEGVFVGEVRDDCYSIKTFIPAIDNGRPSRWRDLHADLWPRIQQRVPRGKTYEADQSSIGDWYFFADGLTRRHPFLLKPYVPGHDYLDAAWASRPVDSGNI